MSDARSDHASPAPSSRSWLRRLLVAQESGLVIVIALLMGLLTIFSGDKPVRERIPISTETVVIDPDGPVMRATIDGVERRFPADAGWTLEERAGTRYFFRETTTNKFLNLENLVSVLVFTSFIAIMAVGITAVIAMGGIDLSIGSTYALAALLGALVLRYNPSGGGLAPTLLGSRAWWILGLILALALLACFAMLRATRLAAPTDPSRLALRTRLSSAALYAGMALLAVVGWTLIASMRDAGAASSSRSQLPLIASLPAALLICCGVGAMAGWFNGMMIVGLRVHPFIITLGTMAAYRGLVALPTSAQSVSGFPPSLQGFVKWDILGVTPVPVLITLLVGILGALVLSGTVLGRRIYAIGGNETAATYAGIPVARVKVTVYTLMGLLAGLSACVYLGYFGAAETNAGQGYELKAIAAAVIGGASLSGGRGSALGAVLGAVLVGLIDNGILMLRIDQNYNQIILGGAIIVAVVLDQFKSRLVPRGH